MKIGFFLENKFYNNVDFSKPELGNPGIRGTQYMMWIIACKLTAFFEIHMYAPSINSMPQSLHTHYCENEIDAYGMAIDHGIDILILRASNDKEALYSKFTNEKMAIILWSHNFESYSLANAIAENKQIKRLVCVGRQQYERLRDHKVFSKTTYIYNALDFTSFQKERIRDDKKIVTYIGALNKLKGFHKLAKVWKKIMIEVPDAQLYVLGSGNMGNAATLGPYGLAEAKYEKKFMKYLLDSHGEIIPSVHFMGNVGREQKEEIILSTSVGIANPTGIGETFCIVATEFEASGVPVVSKKGYGLLDTVIDRETGLLVKNEKELVTSIVRLLKDKEYNRQLGRNGYKFVREQFPMDKIIQKWVELLAEVYEDKEQVVSLQYNYPLNQCKWLREVNRRIQLVGVKIPSLLMWESIKPSFLKFLASCKRRILNSGM